MEYRRLLLDSYNAKSTKDIYDIAVRCGFDSVENWKSYGGNANMADIYENQPVSPECVLIEKILSSSEAICMEICYARAIP